MFTLATTVKSLVQSKNKFKTDSLISPLHYKATVALLLICCAVVSSQQYFGSPIECIQDINGDDAVIPANVINSFCFITATYTQRSTPDGHLSNIRRNSPESQLHAYYQWVPIVLFLQAALFLLPRAIWCQVEGGLIDGCIREFCSSETLPNLQKEHIPPLAKYLSKRINSLTVWGLWHIGHDILNFINITFNIYLVEIFLGGRFIEYGIQTSKVLLGDSLKVSPTDDVFPKLTKCEFHKYGPSGTLQRHDVLCLMAMNIVNEKLYYILWVWFVVVFVATGLMLLLRSIKILLLMLRFRFAIFRRLTSLYDESTVSRILLDNLSLTDVIFMEQLKDNMDNGVFKELMASTVNFLVAGAGMGDIISRQ